MGDQFYFYFNRYIFLMFIYFMILYIYFQLLIGLYCYKYKIRGIEIITMTQIATTFSTFKQQLHTFDTNFDTLSQKLSHITQTRTKINNQLQTLSKQYERKIKQLQNKLDEALVKNQVLVKENKLYQRDIEAFQSRLLEKEKLITMLIVQQGEKFDLIRTKSQIDRTVDRGQQKQKDKNVKKNYQNILPKSINNTQITSFPKKITQNIKVTQQVNEQNKTNQRDIKKTEVIKTTFQSQQKSPTRQAFQMIKNSTNNQLQSRQAGENIVTKTNIPSGMNKKKTTPPPRPSKGTTKSKNNSTIQQENLGDSNQNTKQEQIIDNTTQQQRNKQTIQPKTQQNQKPNIKEQQKTQETTIKNLPPPRPAKKASPAPPNKKIGNNQKFLQDEHIEINQQQQNSQKNQVQKKYAENINYTSEPIVEQKQQRTDNVQGFNLDSYRQDYQESFDTGFNQNKNLDRQQGYQNNEKQVQNKRQAPPPPTHKSIKPSKTRPKNPPKKITQINFYEQSNEQQKNPFQFDSNPFQSMTKPQQNNPFQSQDHGDNPFGQAHQTHQKQQEEQYQPKYQYENNPSSEDFFSQFGTQPTNYPHDQSNANRRSRVLQAQESSIDYADTNSIISSTAVHMFDSQFLPEQTTTIKPESQIKKMTKKKNKRQVQELDPDSFA